MTGIMQMDSFKPENDASDGQDKTFSFVRPSGQNGRIRNGG